MSPAYTPYPEEDLETATHIVEIIAHQEIAGQFDPQIHNPKSRLKIRN